MPMVFVKRWSIAVPGPVFFVSYSVLFCFILFYSVLFCFILFYSVFTDPARVPALNHFLPGFHVSLVLRAISEHVFHACCSSELLALSVTCCLQRNPQNDAFRSRRQQQRKLLHYEVQDSIIYKGPLN
jgi:hypothetical protein